MILVLLLEMFNVFIIFLIMFVVFEVFRVEYKLVKLELLWFMVVESGYYRL